MADSTNSCQDSVTANIVTTINNARHSAPKKMGKEPKVRSGIYVKSFDHAVRKLARMIGTSKEVVRDRLNKLIDSGKVIKAKTRLVLAAKSRKTKKLGYTPGVTIDYSILITGDPVSSGSLFAHATTEPLDSDEAWRRQAWADLYTLDAAGETPSPAELMRQLAWDDHYQLAS